jgi:hypothetical protein
MVVDCHGSQGKHNKLVDFAIGQAQHLSSKGREMVYSSEQLEHTKSKGGGIMQTII